MQKTMNKYLVIIVRVAFKQRKKGYDILDDVNKNFLFCLKEKAM